MGRRSFHPAGCIEESSRLKISSVEKESHPEQAGGNFSTLAACPACGGKKAAVAGSPASGFSTIVAGRSFIQPDYSIMECQNCGLLYKTAILSPEGLGEYYSLVDHAKWEAGELFPTEALVAKILENASPGAKILDFGCSSGRLLSRFVDVHETFGFEVNERSAREAAQKGVRMLSEEEFNKLPSQSFDFVLLIDVFEHLSHPTDLLRSLAELVRSGGQLIIVTGDGDAGVCRVDPAQFWYFRMVEHLTMLTLRHLEWLQTELGLKLESCERVSHYRRSFGEVVYQWARHMAYWVIKTGRPWPLGVLRLSSRLRKTQERESAPPLDVTRDHVVAAYRKR